MLFCEVNYDLCAADRVSVYKNGHLAIKLLPTKSLGNNNYGLIELRNMQRIGNPCSLSLGILSNRGSDSRS